MSTLTERQLKRANLLLHRVYNLIELSHLNDYKMIKWYCERVCFPRQLGEEIFNHLYNDPEFYATVIQRQKRYRRKMKMIRNMEKNQND